MESSSSSVTDALTAEIRRSINALPPAHQIAPTDGEIVDNPQDGYIRLQDWAFTQCFALVKESSRPERVVLHCIHHHEKTRDTRKTEEADLKRAWTTSLSMGKQTP